MLADALEMSTRTVRRHMPKLVRFGYVLVSRRKSRRKMNMSNIYTMLNPFEESQQRLCEANSVKILGQDWQANTIETLSRDSKTKELIKETNTTWEAKTSSVVFSRPSYVTPEVPLSHWDCRYWLGWLGVFGLVLRYHFLSIFHRHGKLHRLRHWSVYALLSCARL